MAPRLDRDTLSVYHCNVIASTICLQLCLQMLPGSQRIAYTLRIFGHPDQAPQPLGVLPTPQMLFPDDTPVPSNTTSDVEPQPSTNVWRPRWAVARDNEAPKATVAELPLKKPRETQEKQMDLKKKSHKKSKSKQKKAKAQFDMFDMFAVDNGDSSSSGADDSGTEDASVDMFAMFPTAKMPRKKKLKVKTKAVKYLKWSQPILLEEENNQEHEEALRRKAKSKAKPVADKQPSVTVKAPPLPAPVPAAKLSLADSAPAEPLVDDGLSNKQRQRR